MPILIITIAEYLFLSKLLTPRPWLHDVLALDPVASARAYIQHAPITCLYCLVEDLLRLYYNNIIQRHAVQVWHHSEPDGVHFHRHLCHHLPGLGHDLFPPCQVSFLLPVPLNSFRFACFVIRQCLLCFDLHRNHVFWIRRAAETRDFQKGSSNRQPVP